MKDAATRSYAKKGDDVVKMNHDAIDAGATAYVKVDVPESWKNCTDDDYSVEVKGDNKEVVDFVKDIQQKVNGQQGNTIPCLLYTSCKRCGNDQKRNQKH